MILHIQKKDRPSFLHACTQFGVVVDFLTDEKVDALCFAQVHTEDTATAYYIGREFERILQEEQDYAQTESNLFDFFKINVP
jgi:hypothetical protein